MCYDTEDLTIPLLFLPYRMCFDKIGDHMITAHRSDDKAM